MIKRFVVTPILLVLTPLRILIRRYITTTTFLKMRGEVEEELYETWRLQLEKRGVFEMGDWKPIGFDEDYEVGLEFRGVGFGFGFAPTCMVILRK